MPSFSPITDDELAQARQDPAFRQRLLQQCLDLLLGGMQRQRQARGAANGSERQMREGVELAVRLAEMIQAADASRKS
jgi:hypothetical protein